MDFPNGTASDVPGEASRMPSLAISDFIQNILKNNALFKTNVDLLVCYLYSVSSSRKN